MASSFNKLPTDMLSDILQRLPAKELCRLRTVCRPWRSLFSDAAFMRAHAQRHMEPLFLAKFRYDETHIYVMDLSGNVVKRIAGTDGGHQVLRTRLNVACLATRWPDTCRVLNPATGLIQTLPLVPAVQYLNGVLIIRRRNPCALFALGWIASKGEYKLLRLYLGLGVGSQQLYEAEVLTTNGGGTDWIGRLGPQFHIIDVHSGVVVDGMVYFLTTAMVNLMRANGTSTAGMPAYLILSFDLERGEWRRDLPSPSGIGDLLTSEQMVRSQLTLADLKGSLVLAHHPHHPPIMDLWFLLDLESGLWVKEYSIWTESVTSSLAAEYHLIPLLAFDDGRLVIYLPPTGLLFICDPGNQHFHKVGYERSS